MKIGFTIKDNQTVEKIHQLLSSVIKTPVTCQLIKQNSDMMKEPRINYWTFQAAPTPFGHWKMQQGIILHLHLTNEDVTMAFSSEDMAEVFVIQYARKSTVDPQ